MGQILKAKRNEDVWYKKFSEKNRLVWAKKNLKAKRNEDVWYQNFLFRKNVWFSRKKRLLAKRNKVIRLGYTEKMSKCSLFIGMKVGKRKGPILKDRRFDITTTMNNIL